MEGESSSTDSPLQSFGSSSPTAVYFCSHCDKPFTNEHSHHRHVRYCENRTRNRPRSCRACNAAKVKCSFETPCSRCTKKSIECFYDGAAAVTRRALPNSTRTALETTSRARNRTTPSFAHELSQDEFLFNSRTTLLDHPDTNGGPFGLVSGNENPLMELSTQALNESLTIDELFAFEDYNPGQIQRVSYGSVALGNKNPQEVPAWCSWAHKRISLSLVAETPTVEGDANLLAIFQIERPLAQHNADIVIQALRSFPTMMLRRETFPWFIHPQSQLLSNSTRGSALPEALSNCMSISQMFALRTSETRGFLWYTVKAAYRGYVKEKHNLSIYEIFAALQTCMVYLVMCIIDQSPESEATGLELLIVLHDLYTVIKEKFEKSPATSQNEISSPNLSWGDWIFAESQRRLTILWFLFGCVVCVKTGIACDPFQSYRHLPLPCPKSLWEAPTQPAWESEYEACRILQTSGLVTLGDLFDAQSGASPVNAQKLDKWNAGVDNLGSLLNLARTMV